jgi:DNA-binding PucR family transcriptional regulator
MTYNESGIYQLLIEVDDMKVLKKFYDQSLGQIVDYDLKNETDLLTILKLYLDYNHSVERVAKETYVHRNTVNYKIKKIKEILDCELTYEDGVRLLLAYHIHEFI